MKVGEIKNLLWDIAKRYPRFQGLLKRQVGNETQGTIWAKDLAAMNLDNGFLQDVCDDYASLRKDLPDPIDNLVKEIADEVRFKQYQEKRRLELHLQAHRPKAGELMGAVKGFRIGKAAIDMGAAVRSGLITEEQNELWLNQLFGWEKGENDLPPNVTQNEQGKVIFSLQG